MYQRGGGGGSRLESTVITFEPLLAIKIGTPCIAASRLVGSEDPVDSSELATWPVHVLSPPRG